MLRGINLGPRNRIAMPALRALLTDAGFDDVRTYVQSGNVVLRTKLGPERIARLVEQRISEELALEIPAIVRSREQLAEVVERNPLKDVAVEPKRYQVTFMESELPAETLERLAAVAAPSERFVAIGRELYAWHPAGVARSKLWAALANKNLGVPGTARNWTTVTTLLAMADE